MNQYNLIDNYGHQCWYLDTEDRSAEVLRGSVSFTVLCWHRLDGPAYIGLNGNQSWYLNDKRHRLDGPAINSTNRKQTWYVNNKVIIDEYDLTLFDSEEGRMILLLKYGSPYL